MTHTFQHIYNRFGSWRFCRTYLYFTPLAIELASYGRLWSCPITSSAFLKWFYIYTIDVGKPLNTLCYTHGKLAEISMNRVTFTNFNEMAVEETKVQANFHLSKLNVRSREQSDTTNLSIGLEYKHIPVVCHEWCQTLHLILFSHNSITIQRAETQEAWKPSFQFDFQCLIGLSRLYIERRIMFLLRTERNKPICVPGYVSRACSSSLTW